MNSFLSDSYRIIDANFNRCKEGLRVCEDISRFHLKNKHLTKRMSVLRHQLSGIMTQSKLDKRVLILKRD